MARDWAKIFGRQLSKVRRAKGLKQHEVEDRIGSGPQYLSHLETGTSKPSFDNIFELAEALDTSAADLFFVEGVDDKREIIRRRIHELLERCDENSLRKIYRLILVALE